MSHFAWITTPHSYQNAHHDTQHALPAGHGLVEQQAVYTSQRSDEGPNFAHLTLLVFEAVLEVVCVSLPGYIVARRGFFDAEAQKFLANMNLMLFTPCLIFSKLAKQLTADTLADLAIIPLIFLVQTLVSYVGAVLVSRCFTFKKRQTNFVIAMGVFGNSNSLPISMVLSLSKTLSGLRWDKVPNDNPEEIGARGILYLLIFQQLGQLLRWSWGYNVLLAPADKYLDQDGGTCPSGRAEQGPGQYRDDFDDSYEPSLLDRYEDYDSGTEDDAETRVGGSPSGSTSPNRKKTDTPHAQGSVSSSRSSLSGRKHMNSHPPPDVPTPINGNILPPKDDAITLFPNVKPTGDGDRRMGPKAALHWLRNQIKNAARTFSSLGGNWARSFFRRLPSPLQRAGNRLSRGIRRFMCGLWEFMNPPLWAMLVAVFVASVPSIQHLFFTQGTFIQNSVTRAVDQSAGVAVPLILVVLGGNLARNTLPEQSPGDISDPREGRNLLIASLVSRMIVPTLVMAPLLALVAKYVPVSIVDDKIFVIVCFLLTGAPTALQLAQICQVNNVYMGVMSNILFQSYVVWLLPSTLVLVLCALQVVDWAAA